MRFLVDARLPPALTRWLRARGHDAKHVADLGMLAASEAGIAARAEETNAILIGKDEDFLILRLPDRFAFVWMRIGNATNRMLEDWLSARWPVVEHMLAAGERLVEMLTHPDQPASQ